LSLIKVNLSCTKKYISIIEEIFVAHEALSISMSDACGKNPIYEPRSGELYVWDVIEVSALFKKKITKKYINLMLQGIPYSNLDIKKIFNQNWIKNYQDNFKTKKFGKKLLVSPSWIQVNPSSGRVVLTLDPGMAFGTGSHETTQLCLEYLDQNPPINLSVIDYGCGSGILGIASILLGAERVIAIDNDPQALAECKKNAKINKVSQNIVTQLNDEILDIKVDLLVANIFSGVLISLTKKISAFMKQGGKVILSGIIEKQLGDLLKSYENSFTIERITKRNSWYMVVLEKL